MSVASRAEVETMVSERLAGDPAFRSQLLAACKLIQVPSVR